MPDHPSIGTVRDIQLVGASTDQMALVEFSSPVEAATALSLNGMKMGDAFTLQVCCVARHGGVLLGAQQQQQHHRGQVGGSEDLSPPHPCVCMCLQPGLVSHGWSAVA